MLQGLREMLEISHRNGSYSNPLLGPRLVSASCQTEAEQLQQVFPVEPEVRVDESGSGNNSFNSTGNSTGNGGNLAAVSPTSAASISSTASPTCSTSPRSSTSSSSVIMNGAIQETEIDGNNGTGSPQRPLSSASEESEDTSSFSEDDEISFNTIKRQVPSKSKEIIPR